ncbi:MAG: tetratricopeptide repeat protein, partial [Terriglobia bacterium]
MRASRAIPTLILAALLFASLSRAAAAQSASAIFEQGIKAFKSRDFIAAEQAFAELAQRDPSAASFNDLAMAEAAAGNLNRAIQDFQKSIQLGNHSAAIRYNLGLAYLRSHQPRAGIEELRKSLATNPKYQPAQYALGVALLDSGRAQEASAYLDGLRKEFPRDPRVWANLAEAQFAAGQSKQAVETAQNAVEEIPNNARLAVTLATICIDYRQIQTARTLLENANELMPEDVEVRLLLAKASLLAGEPVETLAVLKPMPSGAAHPGERLLLMGEARALTGNFGPASVDLAAAMKQSPDNPRYLSAYAWLEQFLGKYNDAIQTLAKARALDPKSPFIPYRIGVSHYFLT